MAPALPLPPAHEDLGPSPWTSGISALRPDSKKILLPSLNHLVPVPAGVSPSAEKSGEAPGRRARSLFPEARGDQQGLLGVLLDLQLLQNQPAPLGPSGAPGGATHRPAPSAVAEPAAHSTPKSRPVSHVAAPGDGEEILVPGSLERAITSPLQASPQLQSQPVSRHLFNPKVWTLSASGASNFRPGNAPLLMLAPRVPEKVVSSAPQGLLAFPSISHVLAATEPLPPVATVQSVLDTASAALTVVSGSPRNGLASGLGLGPSVSPLLSTVPSSQLSSALPPRSYPLTSPSPTLTSLSPIVGPGSPFTARARTSQDASASVLPHTSTGRLFNVSRFPPAQPLPAVTGMVALQRTVQPRPLVPASPASVATLSFRCALGLPAGCPRVLGGVASPQSSSLSRPRQTVSWQDLRSPSPRPSRVTHFVTFRITNEASVVALGNPASPEYQLLKDNIRHQVRATSFVCSGVLTPAYPTPPASEHTLSPLCVLAPAIPPLWATSHPPLPWPLEGPPPATQTLAPRSQSLPLLAPFPTLSPPSLPLPVNHSSLGAAGPRVGCPRGLWKYGVSETRPGLLVGVGRSMWGARWEPKR